MSFPSKEATTNKPQLLLEFGPISDTQAPGTPGGVNAAAAGSSQINLSWTASTDNVGVTGYSIFRNAALVTTVPSSSLSYQDINLTPSTTYSYTLDAFDLAGNHSALSCSGKCNNFSFTGYPGTFHSGECKWSSYRNTSGEFNLECINGQHRCNWLYHLSGWS